MGFETRVSKNTPKQLKKLSHFLKQNKKEQIKIFK